MIELIPIGNVGEPILEDLKHPLAEVFGQTTRIGDSIELAGEGWNQHRGQIPFSCAPLRGVQRTAEVFRLID